MARSGDKQPITRADLEQRFGGFQAKLQGQVEARKASLSTFIGIGATVVVIVVYLVGRRAGKRKTTLVEIRRL